MEVERSKQGAVLVVVPKGRLDSAEALQFEDELMDAIGAGESRLLIDFSSLDYISSAGLSVLLMAAKRLKPDGGRIALCAMNDHVAQVFEVSRFNVLFDIYPGRDDALPTFA
ncbi:MAG: STAS domain-containing protein [Acetobacterales bacterium]